MVTGVHLYGNLAVAVVLPGVAVVDVALPLLWLPSSTINSLVITMRLADVV